jgi:hypothetical protein
MCSMARYRGASSLHELQILNEPRWDIPTALLEDFYRRAYAEIRRHCSPDALAVVIHDGFRSHREWIPLFRDAGFENDEVSFWNAWAVCMSIPRLIAPRMYWGAAMYAQLVVRIPVGPGKPQDLPHEAHATGPGLRRRRAGVLGCLHRRPVTDGAQCRQHG